MVQRPRCDARQKGGYKGKPGTHKEGRLSQKVSGMKKIKQKNPKDVVAIHKSDGEGEKS